MDVTVPKPLFQVQVLGNIKYQLRVTPSFTSRGDRSGSILDLSDARCDQCLTF